MEFNNVHTDRELLTRIVNGDDQAFAKLFHQYRNRIYTVAYKLTSSELLAEEIVQDVFLKIWLKKEKLADVIDFPSFLFIIARNEAYSCLRALAREELKGRKLETWLPHSTEQPDAILLEKEFAVIIREAVDRLPQRQKEIYLLSREQGLKREEIAEKLSLSPETVKAHLSQATKNVRAYCISRLPLSIILIFLHRL